SASSAMVATTVAGAGRWLWRIRASTRIGSRGGSQAMKFTLAAVSRTRSRSAAGPTVRRFAAASMCVPEGAPPRPTPQRAALPHAEAPALTDGVARDTGVGPEHATITVDDRARPEHLWVAPAQEAPIVIVGHEADLLTFRLVRSRQPEPPSVSADGILIEVAHRKVCGGQLRLLERPQKGRF